LDGLSQCHVRRIIKSNILRVNGRDEIHRRSTSYGETLPHTGRARTPLNP
jgi:hypothetical protein